MNALLFTTKYGGPFNGYQPPLLGGGAGVAGGSGMVGGQDRATSRLRIRRSMSGPKYWRLTRSGGTSPFRLVFNAGDPLGTVNSGPDPRYPQVSQLAGRTGKLPTAVGDGVHPGQAGYSGNPKFVYDSSVYTKFRGLSAKRALYNDMSFGGAGQNGQGDVGTINRGYVNY